MGAAYTIFGKTVQPHVLALATLTTVIGGTVLATSGSKAKDTAGATPAAPAVQADNAEDFDVEKLLGDFLKEETK